MSGKSKKKAAGGHSDPAALTAGERPEAAGARPLKSQSPAAGLNHRWLVPGVCLFLAALVWLVFGQALGFGFVNFDDNLYIYENPVVQKGLTWEGFRWALTYGEIGHWHPLTWLSHMLDCQWYGVNPWGHHLTNILLHTATVVLLFLVLRRMTGFLWRCAFVAAVFAIHPLRVESVAWVSERKDVLSAFFFMLTLWAYVRYAQEVASGRWQLARTGAAAAAPDSPSATRHPSLFYWLAVLLFALGLLSKNMLVTMPFVLLLLDYWPLGRFSSFTPRVLRRLVAEKIPLFLLMIGSCVATALVPEKLAADKLSLGLRMENAVVSYVTYLWQMIYPSGLACVYPNPDQVPLWPVAGALGLLLAISGAVWAFRKTHPCLIVGWLWYLGMMMPVIGLVQISYYAHADRYTYLPQIGLYLLLTWTVADMCAGWRLRRVVLGGAAVIILIALILCARTQTAYWRNSELLWTHALACTTGNFVADNNLGSALPQKERAEEAMALYQKALEIKPDYAEACYNLGNALLAKGKPDEAITFYQKALQIRPDYAESQNNLGYALLKMGKLNEAIAHYQAALQIKPDYAEASYNLGDALFQTGNVDEAMALYRKALQIQPDYAEAHYNFGIALLKMGKVDEAIAHYQKALQIKPGYAGAHNNLGNALLQTGNRDEAIAHYQQALQIQPDYAEAHYNLGSALLQKGKVDEAIVHYQQALQIQPGYAGAHNNLANALLRKGRVDEAIDHYQKALQIKPDYAEAHNNLGSVLLKMGKVDEAIAHCQQALQTRPDYAEAHNNLGNALLQRGRVDEAIAHYQQALRIKPDYAEAHNDLGNVLVQTGRMDEAIAHYQKVLQIKPDSLDVLNNLAWLLATCPDAHIRNGVQAVRYAERACELTHYGVTPLVGTLAAAYAEAGRFDEAIATAQKACALAAAANEPDLLERNQKLLALYRNHQSYHEAAEKVVPAAP